MEVLLFGYEETRALKLFENIDQSNLNALRLGILLSDGWLSSLSVTDFFFPAFFK